MNLRTDGRILYVSSVDISLYKAASTNEREFVESLHAYFKERVHFLIPEPENPIDLDGAAFTFTSNLKNHNPVHYPKHVISQLRKANQLIVSREFNFLVFRVDILPVTQFLIARRYKIPYAIKSPGVGLLNSLSEKGGTSGRLLMPVNQFLVRKLITGATAVDVATAQYVTLFTDLFGMDPKNIRHIGNATNTTRFHPMDGTSARRELGLQKFDPIVGFVGSNPWERGGSQMIEIGPQLLAKYPTLGIVIVGGGKGVSGLEKRARELGIQDHCVFPGLLPYDQLPGVINTFDVGISLDTVFDGGRLGNSGLKVRQYIGCGIPLVSGPGEAVIKEHPDLGSVVDVHDIQQVYLAVERWLSLTVQQKADHSEKASSFAREHLSFQWALRERLDFWNERLEADQRAAI